MWSVHDVWFLDSVSTTSETAVLAVVFLVVWRYRRAAPAAFQAIVAALLLCAISASMTDLERSLPGRFSPFAVLVHHQDDIAAGFLRGDWLIFMSWKGLKAACRIAAWCLIVWAALRRPDEPRRRQAA